MPSPSPGATTTTSTTWPRRRATSTGPAAPATPPGADRGVAPVSVGPFCGERFPAVPSRSSSILGRSPPSSATASSRSARSVGVAQCPDRGRGRLRSPRRGDPPLDERHGSRPTTTAGGSTRSSRRSPRRPTAATASTSTGFGEDLQFTDVRRAGGVLLVAPGRPRRGRGDSEALDRGPALRPRGLRRRRGAVVRHGRRLRPRASSAAFTELDRAARHRARVPVVRVPPRAAAAVAAPASRSSLGQRTPVPLSRLACRTWVARPDLNGGATADPMPLMCQGPDRDLSADCHSLVPSARFGAVLHVARCASGTSMAGLCRRSDGRWFPDRLIDVERGGRAVTDAEAADLVALYDVPAHPG